jgi:hypothetical protein
VEKRPAWAIDRRRCRELPAWRVGVSGFTAGHVQECSGPDGARYAYMTP